MYHRSPSHFLLHVPKSDAEMTHSTIWVTKMRPMQRLTVRYKLLCDTHRSVHAHTHALAAPRRPHSRHYVGQWGKRRCTRSSQRPPSQRTCLDGAGRWFCISFVSAPVNTATPMT